MRPRYHLTAAFAGLLVTLGARDALAGCGPELDAATLGSAPAALYAKGLAARQRGRFLEAKAMLRVVAQSYGAESFARTAARLAVESTRDAGDDATPDCYDELAEDAPKYLATYCAGEDRQKHAEDCAPLVSVTRDIGRLRAERLVMKADKNPSLHAYELYAQAGESYLALWNDFYRDACQRGTSLCERADEIVYNASRAFTAARDLERATAARALFFDPANHLASPLAMRALREQGASYMATTDYAQAADFYERYASAAPKDASAPEAMQDALVLRLALHDTAGAEKNVDTFEKLFGKKSPERHAKSIVALARGVGELGDWAKAERLLAAEVNLASRAGPLVQLSVDAALGQAAARLGHAPLADVAYQRVLDQDLPTLVERASSGDDRGITSALRSVSAAMLYVAGKRRDAALKLVTKKGIPETIVAKRAAVDEAARHYDAVLNLKPASPPEAAAAATAQIFRIRSQLAAQAFLSLGEAAAKEDRSRAREAATKCVALSAKNESTAPGVPACAAWLARHEGAHTARPGDLLPRARWLSTDLGPPPPAVPMDSPAE